MVNKQISCLTLNNFLHLYAHMLQVRYIVEKDQSCRMHHVSQISVEISNLAKHWRNVLKSSQYFT